MFLPLSFLRHPVKGVAPAGSSVAATVRRTRSQGDACRLPQRIQHRLACPAVRMAWLAAKANRSRPWEPMTGSGVCDAARPSTASGSMVHEGNCG